MKTLSVLALGTAFALSVPFALPAQAAGLDVKAGFRVDAGADAGADSTIIVGQDVSADAEMDAEAGAEVSMGGESTYTYDDAVAAIENSANAMMVLEGATTFEIIAISGLSAGETADAAALTEAQATAETSLADLHSAVAANTELMAALEAEDYADTDVVGVAAGMDGKVVVFVDG